MKISYNWLKYYVKNIPKPEKLAEILTLHFAEVEEIKKTGKDFVLDIDIRPNRAPDCFSHLGIAREIAAITKSKLNYPVFNPKEEKKEKARDFISVEIKDKSACPRYTAKVINNVKVGSSPQWIKDRLNSCGLRPINNIVDITNYVMLETGQPLHAFDGEKIANKKIIVRFAKKGEKITTLDEQKFDLDSGILLIADYEKPIAIAGVKGGKTPEIDRKTKTVILESANFNSRIIRKSSRKLNLKTDASIRFEHGLDPNLTEFAAKRAAYLIQNIAAGKTAKGLIDVYPKKVFPKKVRLDLNYLKSLLGIEISKKEAADILKGLEFKVKEIGKNILEAEIPTFRLDISISEDLVEEIGRIYGYQKIEPEFPVSSLIPPEKNLNIFWEDITKNILKEAGFTEVHNYSFISEKNLKNLGFKKNNLIEVENPLSEEQKYLRPSLAVNLLKTVQKNQKNFKEIKIFELGKVFVNLPKYKEERRLAGIITGDAFYHAKGIIDLLLMKLGIGNIFYDDFKINFNETDASFWHSKKCAEIKIDSQKIGFLGEVSPKVTDVFDISHKIVLFDINFDKLSEFVSEEHEYRPISRFPSAIRDIAVLVPRKIKVVEVLNKINAAGGALIRDVDLFDIYEGGEIPEGKKNLAFHLIYQAEDKTLNAKEIDNLQDKIIKTLEKNPEWQVRK